MWPVHVHTYMSHNDGWCGKHVEYINLFLAMLSYMSHSHHKKCTCTLHVYIQSAILYPIILAVYFVLAGIVRRLLSGAVYVAVDTVRGHI